MENNNESVEDLTTLRDGLKPSGTTYTDIISYNNYNNPGKGVDQLSNLYTLLFEYGLWLAGFQFIGITVEGGNNFSSLQEVSFFILNLGLAVSIFSCLTSFIVLEFLNGIKSESNKFVYLGIQKYRNIFKIADILLFISTMLFACAINLIIYESLSLPYCIVLNVISICLVIKGMIIHYGMLGSKQEYRKGDEFFTNFIKIIMRRNKGNTVSRKITTVEKKERESASIGL